MNLILNILDKTHHNNNNSAQNNKISCNLEKLKKKPKRIILISYSIFF